MPCAKSRAPTSSHPAYYRALGAASTLKTYAKKLNVDTTTFIDWLTGRFACPDVHYPQVLTFLRDQGAAHAEMLSQFERRNMRNAVHGAAIKNKNWQTSIAGAGQLTKNL